MLLSEIIPQIDADIGFKIVNEDSCSFLDTEDFAECIGDHIKMLIVSENIVKKIHTYKIGLCIVDHPRLTYFKIHNFLSNKNDYKRKFIETVIGENCNISKISSISTSNVAIGNNVTMRSL